MLWLLNGRGSERRKSQHRRSDHSQIFDQLSDFRRYDFRLPFPT
jgi:hypothetical protein